MTRNPRRLCKSLLASSLASAFAIWPGLSHAQAVQTPASAQASARVETNTEPVAAQELYLDVVLNRVRTGKVARFEVRDQQLWSDTATLKDIGLRVPDADAATPQMLALSSIPGLAVDYNPRTQRVMLQASVALLGAAPTQVEVPPTRAAQARPEDQLRGLVVNYDLYAQQMRADRNVTSLSAMTEMRLMGVGSGNLGNTMITRSVTGLGSDAASNAQRGTVRLGIDAIGAPGEEDAR